MKKKLLVTLLLVLSVQLISHAQSTQMYEKGETFPDITLTDINGKKYNLHEYMDNGYAIVIELALTTCGDCWGFKNSGVFNAIYEQYGPSGTKRKGKILPFFVESNVNNSRDQLFGKGEGTLGDWVTGAKYPIIDLADNEELAQFFKAPPSIIITPSFYFVCSDKKVHSSFVGLGELDAIYPSFIRNLDNCAKPTAIDEFTMSSAVKVYPSPGVQKIHVELSVDDALLQDITLINIEGRSVMSQSTINANKTTVDVADLPGGIYMVSITLNDGTKLTKRIVVAE